MSDRNHWTALRQRKISRRTMLGASAKAGVGAAGLALVGCGDDDEPDAGAVAAERAATAAEEAAAGDSIAAGEARAAETEAAADAAAEDGCRRVRGLRRGFPGRRRRRCGRRAGR